MKKIISVLTALILIITLVACNSNISTKTKDKPSLVATSFYQYDWLMEVLGEKADDFNVTLLVDDGTDLHNYEPTVADMLTITTSDMFIYNGGESDDWAKDVMSADESKELNAISVMAVLEDDILAHAGTSNVDGEVCCEDHDHEDHNHEDEDHEDHDHEDDEHEDHDHEDEDDEHEHEDHDHVHENDEHVWLSLENAIKVTKVLADEISKIDADNKAIYQENATKYTEKLTKLDDAYETLAESSERDTLIFADRFPFAYLLSDYDLSYYAAFEGCSAETEASFETIAWLTDAANENNVNYLLVIENGTTDIADTIINGMDNKNCVVLMLDSMQSVDMDSINKGTSYYSIMSSNLETLALALDK